MRYAILIFDEGTVNPPIERPTPEEWEQVMEGYSAYTQLLKDRGLYLGGEALQPVQTATTVRVVDDETITTDGPYAETKEALGGFYLIEARDLDEALEVAARCPGARNGSVEVRPIYEIQAAAGAEAAAGRA